MKCKDVIQRLGNNEKRKLIFLNLKQPMTALQISKHTELTLSQCSLYLGQMTLCGLVKCLNPAAKRSRIYWLTAMGILCQKELQKGREDHRIMSVLKDINWELYGWVCYRHRSAIIRALTEPLQPAEIKRRAKLKNSDLRMSANNVRDVIRLFLKKEIVQPVKIRRKAHLRYELTVLGGKLRDMLTKAYCEK